MQPASALPIRVMLADDNRYFRDGVRAALQAASMVQWVCEAATGEEAVRVVHECKPHVVLIGLNMPGLDGIETTRRILKELPGMGVILLTISEDTDSVIAALRVGARGYLLRDAPVDELLRSIQAVAKGDALFGAAVAARLVSFVNKQSAPAVPLFPELTDREREILTLAAQGMSNAQIAEHGVLSVKTVRNHFSSILLKLAVTDRDAAIRSAKSAGLGS